MAFECPRGTRFQQRTMVCDHEHLVECHQSAKYFHSNLRIGQANVNFIDDKQRSSSKYGYLLNILLTHRERKLDGAIGHFAEPL